jgi:outer membrane usher protein
VNDRQVNSPIGDRGEFYLENIPPGNYIAKVDYTKGMCSFDLNVPQSEQPLVNLGNLKCTLP